MNDLESELYRIVDIVVECCVTTISASGKMSLTRAEVLGQSRKENVCYTRTILATALTRDGFSVTTIAQLLNKSEAGIRKMLVTHEDLKKTSNAYRIACAEIKRRVQEEKDIKKEEKDK